MATDDLKKHKYVIHFQGSLVKVNSMELPNATEELLDEIWEEQGPFVNFLNNGRTQLVNDVADIERGKFGYHKKAEETLKKLAGEVTTDKVKVSKFYPDADTDDQEYSLSELTDEGEYVDVAAKYQMDVENLDVEFYSHLSVGANLDQNIENYDYNDALRTIYEENGFDESYTLSFMDESVNFEAGKWYLINVQHYNYDQIDGIKAYLIETDDEEFNDHKFEVVHTDITGTNACAVAGLFYDSKLMSIHREPSGENYFPSSNSRIVRFKEGNYGLKVDKSYGSC